MYVRLSWMSGELEFILPQWLTFLVIKGPVSFISLLNVFFVFTLSFSGKLILRLPTSVSLPFSHKAIGLPPVLPQMMLGQVGLSACSRNSPKLWHSCATVSGSCSFLSPCTVWRKWGTELRSQLGNTFHEAQQWNLTKYLLHEFCFAF